MKCLRLQAALQESDAESTIKFVMKEALKATPDGALTVAYVRKLMLAFVERVDGPVDVDTEAAGLPKGRRCRGVWVTLRLSLNDPSAKQVTVKEGQRSTGVDFQGG